MSGPELDSTFHTGQYQTVEIHTMTGTVCGYKAPHVNISNAQVSLHGRTEALPGYDPRATCRRLAHVARVVIPEGGAVVNGKRVHGSVSLALMPGLFDAPVWVAREAYIYRDREDRERGHQVPEATSAMRAAVRAAAVAMVSEFATPENLAAAEVERLRDEAERGREVARQMRQKAEAIDARAMLFFKAAEVIAESREPTTAPLETLTRVEE